MSTPNAWRPLVRSVRAGFTKLGVATELIQVGTDGSIREQGEEIGGWDATGEWSCTLADGTTIWMTEGRVCMTWE